MFGLEYLVIGLCLGGYECSTATRAYYLQNQELREAIARTERQAKELVGPFVSETVVPYALPIAMLLSGQKGRVNLDSHWSIEIEPREQKTFINWNL